MRVKNQKEPAMSTKIFPAHRTPTAIITASFLLLLLAACAGPMSTDDTYFMAQNALHQGQAAASAVLRV